MTLGGVGHVQESVKNGQKLLFGWGCMKKKQHLDVSYKYFLRVRSFYDFNEILNEILSVVFLDIKKTR